MSVLRTLLLIVLVVAAGGCAVPGGPDRIAVVAAFDNSAGLYVGNAVAVLGMPIGKVTAITPRGDHIDVAMELDADVPIPADATAVMLSTSVLTDRHIEFTPPYRGGPALADGARITPEHTRTPVGIDRLVGAAERMSGELGGDGAGNGPIARLLDVAAASTGNRGDDMRATLDELARALRVGDDGGAQTRDTVTAIVDQLSELTGAAARNEQTIAEFGTSAGQLGDVLADLEIGSGDTGAQLTALLTEAEQLLADNREPLRATTADANVVLGAVAEYRDQVAEFLDLTPMLLANGYNAVDIPNRGFRVRALLDKVFFDGQIVKEVCNILGLRQLGCATGTLRDFGPDFGISDLLEAMATVPR
ncbi:MCE family protein [Nocardia sp. NPDC050697]|uniref:MCE family protein n=1 Tax=Nocardia sp. NPDC050697 TaxID=3155158 RepID=UPI00340B3FDA